MSGDELARPQTRRVVTISATYGAGGAAVGPLLAERLGSFASHIATGNPRNVRLTYYGRIAEQNTTIVRNAGLAGVLNRSLAQKANAVNSVQIAGDRGVNFAVIPRRSPIASEPGIQRSSPPLDSGFAPKRRAPE